MNATPRLPDWNATHEKNQEAAEVGGAIRN